MESFWDFSVRTYRTNGVPGACLALQNDHGADVNMLLYCCWTGAAIGVFDRELFKRASGFSVSWADNVVIPLRDARTWMKHAGCNADSVPKDSCMELREEIKTVEFAAEKMQQEVLESMLSVERESAEEPAVIIGNVAANLLLYLEFADIQADGDVREKLSTIILAAFPEIDREIIATAFEN